MKERYEKMKEYVPEEAREHYKKAREEMRESIRALFPKEFIERRWPPRRWSNAPSSGSSSTIRNNGSNRQGGAACAGLAPAAGRLPPHLTTYS